MLEIVKTFVDHLQRMWILKTGRVNLVELYSEVGTLGHLATVSGVHFIAEEILGLGLGLSLGTATDNMGLKRKADDCYK